MTPITDWDKWMKDRHIKIYTEEELFKKTPRKKSEKGIDFYRRHKEAILKGVGHASET